MLARDPPMTTDHPMSLDALLAGRRDLLLSKLPAWVIPPAIAGVAATCLWIAPGTFTAVGVTVSALVASLAAKSTAFDAAEYWALAISKAVWGLPVDRAAMRHPDVARAAVGAAVVAERIPEDGCWLVADHRNGTAVLMSERRFESFRDDLDDTGEPYTVVYTLANATVMALRFRSGKLDEDPEVPSRVVWKVDADEGLHLVGGEEPDVGRNVMGR